jgi:hypothetical protein
MTSECFGHNTTNIFFSLVVLQTKIFKEKWREDESAQQKKNNDPWSTWTATKHFYQTTNIWEDLLYMKEYIYTVYIVIMYLNLIIILKNERDFKTGYCM